MTEVHQLPGMRGDLVCADCHSLLKLRLSKHGPFYGCSRWPECHGVHGAHPDGKPKGTPANKQTRLARIRAHVVFDPIWKQGILKRHEAYSWMRKAMALSRSQAHIAMFSEAQCEQLIRLVYRDYPQFRTRYSSILYDDFERDL